MLRNWVSRFGFDPGKRAGGEQISEPDRAKFIDQVGRYLGWNPPPRVSWTVEVDAAGVVQFSRRLTAEEKELLLGDGYKRNG
jgi:hypothetical protein